MKDNTQKKAGLFGRSIGAKLILIITVLVIVSLGTITFLVSYFMGKDVQVTAEDNNLTITLRTASSAETVLASTRSNVSLLLDMLQAAGSDGALASQASEWFFERNSDVAGVIIPGSKELINSRFFIAHEVEADLIEKYLNQHDEDVIRAIEGEALILNAAPVFEIPVLVYMFPWEDEGEQRAAVVFFSSDSLSTVFGTGNVNESFMINHDGDLLLHADFDLVKAGVNMSTLPLVSLMRLNGDENRQVLFTNTDGKEYFGAYCKLPFADVGVITMIEKSVALKAVTNQTQQNIWLTLAVLFVAVLFIYFYSKTLSTPLQSLTAVANEIKQGNFNTELFDLLNTKDGKKARQDEIGVLIESTKDEREILNTVSRLTNKGVAKAVVRKEIDFEPHLKDITIFFSDIRGFTAISDGFKNRFGEKSAGEIISFLNDYMSRMVNCINISGGNVDKFEGDAIMACWGVLRDDSLDFELWPDSDPRKAEMEAKHKAHIQQDAVNAIRAQTAMRYSLMEYNKHAEAFTKEHEGEPMAKYKPHIRIGSGLNSGRATVGFMGSMDKMEFTSIGDAVNFASRTEASNKPCGTDMLITEDTYNLLKMDYIRCKENNYTIKPENLKNEVLVEVIPVTFEVKGKGQQHFYGVVNMPNFDVEEFFKTTDPDFVADPDCIKAVGPLGPKTMNEVRQLLGIPIPDFAKVDLDAEENKITAV
ncbi:MAG: adenylate/guanylate cyclase domain-containing protein [Treponema sp.]|nr:adenylate/guanylate cyclase domain-containing protein [Candidatus Treponema caballi]